ncbi:hypothetical protein ABPG75_004569 [Micractinium tetrahymenae]
MDAFSMLAAPAVAAAAAGGGKDPSQLIAFFAQEMQLFFQHIQGSVTKYTETGELPPSLFTKKALKSAAKAGGRGRGKKEGGEKRKRKPSAFNLFVQERMAQMKAAGVQPPKELTEGETKLRNPLFTMAAKEWGQMSDDEKKAYSDKVAPRLAAMGEGTAPAKAEAAPAAEEEEEEESEEEEEEEEEEEKESEESEESSSSEEEAPPKKAPPPPVESHKKKKHKSKH